MLFRSEALVWLCRHHGIDRSEHSLTEGRAGHEAVTPDQALQILRGAGFSASLVQRKPGKILSLLMPVVMLLRNGDAVIVLQRIKGKGRRSPDRYEVLLPGADNEVCTATEDELLAEYSGYTIIAAPKPGARTLRSTEEPNEEIGRAHV